MRWIWIDRFEKIEKGSYCKGLRSVGRSEGALSDYYPCYPFMPSSFMIEMMAQVGGVLVGATIDFKKEVVLAKVNQAKFPQMVTPPDLLEIEAELKDESDSGALTDCKITSSGKLIARASIFFALFDQLSENGKRGAVFSKDFMETYAIQQLIEEPSRA